MSLNIALGIATAGLRTSSTEVGIVSQNITNADTEGYTKRRYETDLFTSADVLLPSGGRSVSIRNSFLERSLIDDSSLAFKDLVMADSLTGYQARLGSTGGGSSMSAILNDFNNGLIQLSSNPDDINIKYSIIENAEQLTASIRAANNSIQDLRTQADKGIAKSIDSVNESLAAIADLNAKIVRAEGSGNDASNFEDQRFIELQKLSQSMDINYFVNSNNEVRIYSPSGVSLVGAGNSVYTYNFTPTSPITSDLAYPGTLSGISLNGVDATSDFRSGSINGYLELRDVVYVEEQEKLNEFSAQLEEQLNAASNQGTAIPVRNSLIGDEEGLTLADPVTATGFARIATVDANGIAQSFVDVDLSTAATVGDLVALFNSVPGVTAALNADGALVVTATNPAEGIAMNALDGQVGPNNRNLSHFFGLNNIITQTDARNVRVSDYLTANPLYLPSNYLSNDPALAVGDQAISVSNNTAVNLMSDSLTGNTTNFAAAGNFAAQTNSLISYANSFISNAASRASNADISANITDIAYQTSRTTLGNQTGVNVDEETARLLELENAYQSSALIIQTVRDLFDTLIGAVN
ncbi:MAG: flagellar hook-associated protein FlgK [Micavibrio sp.]|mgnify:CR=1 FL=1|nr:flagellar hook-associated protein FlgK [Micavibrio sp.]